MLFRSCGDSSETLEVHHSRYFPNQDPWDIFDEFLITYCHTCHERITELSRLVRERLDDVLTNGCDEEDKLYFLLGFLEGDLTDGYPAFICDLLRKDLGAHYLDGLAVGTGIHISQIAYASHEVLTLGSTHILDRRRPHHGTDTTPNTLAFQGPTEEDA